MFKWRMAVIRLTQSRKRKTRRDRDALPPAMVQRVPILFLLRRVMEKKVLELFELIADEHEPQELRGLIMRLTILLQAKEQKLRDQEKRPNTTSTSNQNR
jgi:hypothetical protein